MRDFKKIYGCLVGGAVGDALGYAIEFVKEDYIFQKYGEKGIQEYELTDGKAIFSDDTQMTLFTAEGILLAKDPMNYTDYITGMYDAYQEWFGTQVFSRNVFKKKKIWLSNIKELQERRAPGITCLNALESKKLASIYEPINNSKGCGGVMRVAPIGLYYSPDDISWKDIDLRGAQAAALTHGHPLGYIPAAALVHIVNLAMYRPEMSLLQIVEDAIEKVCELFEEDDSEYYIVFEKLMRKTIELAASDEIDDLDAIHMLGEGWVAEEALAIAVYCALKYPDDFGSAMIAAVNHKGDSDSTGAIAGNILGVYLGIDAIPEKFISNLEMLDVIEKVAHNLSK